MALINLGSDPWLTEYESCDRLQREIFSQIRERNEGKNSAGEFAKLSANLRLRIKQYENELSQLRKKLFDTSRSQSITFDESQRRQRLLEALDTKRVQILEIFNETNVVQKFPSRRADGNEREQLFGVTQSGTRLPSKWIDDDDDDDDKIISLEARVTVEDVKTMQQRMLEDQNEGLEVLSKVISRQKNIARSIGQEVDVQNDLIDDIGDHIERTDARINNQTQNIRVVDRKDRTCGYWVVIIILLIANIAVASI